MNFEIVELEELSGPAASVYSIILENDSSTLFDSFMETNLTNHRREIESIKLKLEKIGWEYGAREQFFKINEGKPGDGVCALYDSPESKFRLFCIRYGSLAIILGGGALKPRNIRSWQEDPKLDAEARLIVHISEVISEAILTGKIKWSKDGLRLLGDFKFLENE